ncbi:M48 family metallopeptidase [Trichocoleus sp. FACHB-591]|uniref:M48 family metallopeptidase n=1 Tax=Trichocoleus sp. FACHB-591 TaxID=2692872 RepID=UPI0016855D1C|nr:SprT family zinc-dependent metalloprotease [Trichocoleus sp. FACHB-591]MBD2096096.1 M48 family metallopeptidase [Trichocoleus sp. FACHB-591]
MKSRSPQPQLANLPNYKVRESHKAKHVNLKISPHHGLEVVVPKGFDHRRIPEILQKKQKWIDKIARQFEAQQEFLTSNAADQGVTEIVLQAIAETWRVEYVPTTDPHVVVTEKPGQQLQVRGAITQKDLCHKALCKWLAHKARTHLVPWLRTVSHKVQLPFEQASVRGQKTRWASCSQNKMISLNYKLLFLPPEVVRYVFVHELCHTIHMNHSSAFWQLVGAKDPNYEQLDAELHNIWRYVPAWVEH